MTDNIDHHRRESVLPGCYLVVGPARHGVVAHALRLGTGDSRLSSMLVRVPAASGAAPRGLLSAVPSGCVVMMHVTDRLLGGSPPEAAQVVDALAGRGPLVLVLHDVPQPAEGRQRYLRRARAYAQMARAARIVVVASEHERRALGRCIRAATGREHADSPITVVPLPIQCPPADAPATPQHPVDWQEIGVFGYLYPGKGVQDVVDAVATLRREERDVRVTCLGAVAEGHAEYADALVRRAACLGVPFQVSGYVPRADLSARLRSVTVPVASHRHVSASGSINVWLESGRRPVALSGSYTQELQARLPGALQLTANLETGIRDALDDPGRTWLGPELSLGPSVAQAARAHADLLDAVARAGAAAGGTGR